MSDLKAYIVTEPDENTGGVVFAKSNAHARRLGSSEYGSGDFDWGTARREPGLDKYAETGHVPWIEMFNRGWWRECCGCGGRIEEGHIDDDGNDVEFEIVQVGENVYCRRECREQHVAERAVEDHVKAVTIADMTDQLLRLMPGATIVDKSHVYVPAGKTPRQASQALVYFAFPGMLIGPGCYRFDKLGQKPYVTVCTGDRLAFARWRAAGYPPHMMDAAEAA